MCRFLEVFGPLISWSSHIWSTGLRTQMISWSSHIWSAGLRAFDQLHFAYLTSWSLHISWVRLSWSSHIWSAGVRRFERLDFAHWIGWSSHIGSVGVRTFDQLHFAYFTSWSSHIWSAGLRTFDQLVFVDLSGLTLFGITTVIFLKLRAGKKQLHFDLRYCVSRIPIWIRECKNKNVLTRCAPYSEIPGNSSQDAPHPRIRHDS